PGETEGDFEQLCDFVREAQFDWMGAFAYSDEEGSAAHHLESKVSAAEIRRRQRKLMQVQKQISRKKKRSLIGKQFDVLLEGESSETELLWEGRAEMHAPEIDGKLYINDFGPYENVQPGEFHRCEVTEAHDYDLVARLVLGVAPAAAGCRAGILPADLRKRCRTHHDKSDFVASLHYSRYI